MAYLASFLISAFGSLIGFFTTYLSKKLVMGAAVITFFVALFAAFFATVQTMLVTIQYSITNTWLTTALYMLWPPHVTICISVSFAATVAKWVYVETRERARAVLYIT